MLGHLRHGSLTVLMLLAGCSSGGEPSAAQDSSILDSTFDGGRDSRIDAEDGSDSTIETTDAYDTAADTDSGGEDGPIDAEAEAGDVDAEPLDTAPGGVLKWAENFGVSGHTVPMSVSIGPSSGEVAVCGQYFGTTDFGGGPVTSVSTAATGADGFVVKYDSTGKYNWAKTFAGWASANGVGVDAGGNVSVAGVFRGTVDFGGGPLTAVGTQDLFLVQLDGSGAFKWAKTFGAVGQIQNQYTLALDSAGNVFITGRCVSLDFGGGVLPGCVVTGGGVGGGFFVAEFNSAGGYAWSKAFAAATTEGGPWLAVDPLGNTILAGNFEGTVNFGGGLLTSPSGGTRSDVFIAKFDSSGAYQWAKHYGNGAASSGVATDTSGNIFIAGDISFSGTTMDFGAGATVTASDSTKNYVFLASVSPSGAGIWAQPIVGSSQVAGGITTTSEGATIAVGSYGGSIDFGGGPVPANSGLAFASFDSAGSYRWAYAADAPSTAAHSGSAYIQGLIGSATSLVVAGGFGQPCSPSTPTCSTTSVPGTTLVFPGKTLNAASANDLLLAVFTP